MTCCTCPKLDCAVHQPTEEAVTELLTAAETPAEHPRPMHEKIRILRLFTDEG